MGRMDSRYISLLGKMINKYQVNMSDLMDYEEHERDLLRSAKTEYDFYHAHERVEAPLASNDIVETSRSEQAGKRKVLGIKATG
jgi:hypothetical protein